MVFEALAQVSRAAYSVRVDTFHLVIAAIMAIDQFNVHVDSLIPKSKDSNTKPHG